MLRTLGRIGVKSMEKHFENADVAGSTWVILSRTQFRRAGDDGSKQRVCLGQCLSRTVLQQQLHGVLLPQVNSFAERVEEFVPEISSAWTCSVLDQDPHEFRWSRANRHREWVIIPGTAAGVRLRSCINEKFRHFCVVSFSHKAKNHQVRGVCGCLTVGTVFGPE
ncbi:hypothetical protein BKA80DRAFT_146533 [Phyllosticta citrichinensis]